MRYFSMFSGIGGFELGIQRAYDMQPETKQLQMESNQCGDNGELLQRTASCVGYSEIDKYAIKVYERNFNGHTNYGDATAIDAAGLPDFDLLVGGFPCQAFSIAGKRHGFNETRGTLFFDIARILKHKRPRHLVLENVKGLLSHDGGQTFTTIIGVLTDLGYYVEWQVLNSKDFGVPQNRERVYIVGHLGNECGRKVFPIAGTNQEGIIQLNQPRHSNDRIFADSGLAPTLNTMQGGLRQPFVSTRWQRTEKGKAFRREAQRKGRDLTPFNDGYRELLPVPDKPVGAITSQAIAKDSLLSDFSRIRRLTPLECERLQGFPDDWTLEGTDGLISDTQRYKMCGNAVTVNVVQTVMERLLV